MHDDAMKPKRSPQTPRQPREGTRITVTVPEPHYAVVLELAAKKKVSASWVVRDAIERYIQQEAPNQAG
jgi:metal-responsive CopG/Arc/MetJ family transcriptional regulator